ncbi:Isochorismatase hydrolase [Xylariaceae sp. FL1272]|nr:Isochorismatase hydrolase [Xylariaceae sp. FL1272]
MTDPPITLSFGPQGDQWLYDRESNTYDITRGQVSSTRPGWAFETTQGAERASLVLAPDISALIIVDMQNFFLHPRCNDYPDGLTAVDRVLGVIKQCRKLGVKVIWVNWGLKEIDLPVIPAATAKSFSTELISGPGDSKQARRGFGTDMGDDRGRLLMEGEWNAALYDPLREASDEELDIFCSKDRISALWHGTTALADALEENSIRTLVFAGVNTDQCVFGTLADAYYQGFDCIMLEDCCATKTPGGQDVTVWNASRGYGFVTDSEAFCSGSAAKARR